MRAYRTQLHRRLMEESEKGLFAAIGTGKARWGYIAEEIAYDCRKFTAWESRHARLLEPLAQTRRRGATLASLRRAEMILVHRRALLDTVRAHKLTGTRRERVFRFFYGPQDFHNSVLTEHFQYQLAVASSVAAVRLSELCRDPAGLYLLEKYETAYRRYFWAYCEWRLNENPLMTDVLRLSMEGSKAMVDRLKQRLCSGPDLKAWAHERLSISE